MLTPPSRACRQVKQFNAQHIPGAPVTFRRFGVWPVRTVTSCRAHIVHGRPVVHLLRVGFVSLDRVMPA